LITTDEMMLKMAVLAPIPSAKTRTHVKVYEGTVLRLERGARSQRELIQAGCELAGVPAPHGDAEVIALGAAALAASGLGEGAMELTIDLGHLGLMREVFTALNAPPVAAEAIRRAIAKRDPGGLDAALEGVRAPAALLRFVRALPQLAGDPSVLARAARQAPTPAVGRAIAELEAIVDAVVARGVPARLHVDLGEVRGFDYYTGVRFQGFVAGAAEAVLQGGRYDDLLGRYGRPSAAVGFAIDVEAAVGALEAAAGGGEAQLGPPDVEAVLVVGAPAASAALAAKLRVEGKRAAALLTAMPEREIAAYAARWGYGRVISAEPEDTGGRATKRANKRANKKEPRGKR